MADVQTSATTQALGFANLLLLRRSNAFISLSDSVPDQPPPSALVLQVSNSCKTLPRKRLTKRRRTKRTSFSGDDSNGSGDGGFYADENFDGGSGFSSGGGGGGAGDSGGGWGFGGNYSDDSSSWSHSGSRFAFDFIYEVIYWIALSNCVHFAFKKVLRTTADVVSDVDRDKVPMQLVTVC